MFFILNICMQNPLQSYQALTQRFLQYLSLKCLFNDNKVLIIKFK